jgi:hypothetical protein
MRCFSRLCRGIPGMAWKPAGGRLSAHWGAPFSLGWRSEQSQPIAKVGAFLYCVLLGFFVN